MGLRNKLSRLRKSVFTVARRHGATFKQASKIALKTTRTAKRIAMAKERAELAGRRTRRGARKAKRLALGKYTPAEKKRLARYIAKELKAAGV